MVILLLLPLIVFLPGLSGFFYPVGSIYSDLAISHFPNSFYLLQSIIQYKQIPLWSSTILSGYPYFADPLSGLWYPPGWLALLFPLPLGINLIVLFHILFGGLGLYQYLLQEGLKPPAALVGGLLFELFPKIAGHYVAGHITLIYAVCWTPWLLWALRKQMDRPRFGIGILLPGTIMGVIFLADPRWVVYAAILWGGYSLSLVFRYAKFYGREVFENQKRSLLWSGISGIIQPLVAVAIAAPLLLPLYEFTSLSTRSVLTSADRLIFSLPPARLLGIIFPNPAEYVEWIIYPGLFVVAALVMSAASAGIRKKCWGWLVLILASLIFSLGSDIPGMSVLLNLPGLNLLRVPPRIIFLASLSMAVVSGYFIDVFLGENIENDLETRFDPIFFLTGTLAFIVFAAGILLVITGKLEKNYMWGAVGFIAIYLWILARRRQWISSTVWFVGVLLFVIIDLEGVNIQSFVSRTRSEILSEGVGVAEYLRAQPGVFRVYSPSYSLPQQTAVLYGLELADGVDPLQLTTYANYMELASGVPSTSYSVTIPPYNQGSLQSSNLSYHPDIQKLSLLNVMYVVSDFDLLEDGLLLRAKFGEKRIYQNLDAYPRAWMQEESGKGEDHPRSVDLVERTPNRIVIDATGPGLVVLSEINYPGWNVEVDGKPSELLTVQDIFRGAAITSGEHEIIFQFSPVSLKIGIVLAGLAWLVILLTMLWEKRVYGSAN